MKAFALFFLPATLICQVVGLMGAAPSGAVFTQRRDEALAHIQKNPWPNPEKNVDFISFRWGMYVGSQKGQSVPKDAILFVTGATIRRFRVGIKP